MKRPLTALAKGECGYVTAIVSGGSGKGRGRKGHGWGFEKRLADMGLTPGTKVTLVSAAPFHGPLEILVRGSRLALGRGMAQRVVVEVTR